jgi:putative flavoprotein involved in K+ transport
VTPTGERPGTNRPQRGAARSVDVLIIGAGQAGLGAAYWLQRRTRLQVQIIDKAPVGHSWITRWESLRLFTPRRFSSLPGMRFPSGNGCPTRAEMAAYLNDYADRFDLPVDTGHKALRLTSSGDGFHAATTHGDFRARHVIVATGPFSRPNLPPASRSLDDAVFQLHSADYRRASDVPEGEVLVVGGGNSAAQLALELADTHRVTVISPRPLWFLPDTLLGVDLYWWLYLTGTLNAGAASPPSRYVRRRGDAIIGTELRRQLRGGRISLRTQRVLGGNARHLVLADGSRLIARSVLWCTGFRPDLSWIELPGALDAAGEPVHYGGASSVAGLHWMGLPWQTRLNSSLIDGVDRDARATAARIQTALQTRA